MRNEIKKLDGSWRGCTLLVLFELGLHMQAKVFFESILRSGVEEVMI